MNTDTIKGFQDYTGEEALKRAKIRGIIENEFKLFGFEPVETPLIESEEFVERDNPNDEAVSQTFKLEDRGKRKLALRYEFTFQLKRIAKNQKLPYKRYQIGEVFRDEPVSSNRFRQFTQMDVDTIGSGPKDEAESFSLLKNILDKLGIEFVIYFNNRKLLNEIMVSEKIEERNREQVIRELDKLDKLSKVEVANNLKKIGAEKILKIFDKGDFRKYGSYKEIGQIEKLCKEYSVKLEFLPTLARGLSYYNGTILEVKTKEMKETVCAGGAYLVGGIQSFGFSLGLDRISTLSKISIDKLKVQVISLGKDKEAINLTNNLREKGISTILILDKTTSKAMEYANAKGIENVIFVGEEEIKKGRFKVKNMINGKESFLATSELIKSLK